MNNNLGVLGTLVCMALTWWVGSFFGTEGFVIGMIFFLVVLGNCIFAKIEEKHQAKIDAMDRQKEDALRRIAELKKRNG